MNYWIINGMPFKAVELSTALHKYGQWYFRKFGKVQANTSGAITWMRIPESEYKRIGGK